MTVMRYNCVSAAIVVDMVMASMLFAGGFHRLPPLP
jgi:hypothetical protein